MSSASGSSSSSGPSSRDDNSASGSNSSMDVEGGVQMEVIPEVRKDPPEEVVTNILSAKTGYDWVALDVRTQYSLFRWSRLLNSWLGCVSIF